jgi:hypothetical protein
MGEFAPASVWRKVGNSATNGFAHRSGYCIGAAEAYDLRSTQSGERFAKRTSREDVIEAEGFESVEEYDIEIASQTAMLEAVVENKKVGFELVDCVSSTGDAIAVLDVRYVGQRLGQFARFVVLFAGGCAVAAADERYTRA